MRVPLRQQLMSPLDLRFLAVFAVTKTVGLHGGVFRWTIVLRHVYLTRRIPYDETRALVRWFAFVGLFQQPFGILQNHRIDSPAQVGTIHTRAIFL